MAATSMDGPSEQHRTITSAEVAEHVRNFNASNQAHEDLWARAHQAGDAVCRGVEDKDKAQLHARHARDFHLAVQAEYPHRRAPLMRQALIAAFTTGLDGVACWFAAQALGNGQTETLLWTALFLAVLGTGEVALDHYSEHSHRVWQLLVGGLLLFVAGLGVLRFLYLATVGGNGPIAALVGAALFTGATAGFLVIGYRALRAAEMPPAWRARKRSRQADRQVSAASQRVARLVRERDRLVDAYVSRIRVGLLEQCESGELPQLVAAVRRHLTGRDLS
jgi:hypothetical protein